MRYPNDCQQAIVHPHAHQREVCAGHQSQCGRRNSASSVPLGPYLVSNAEWAYGWSRWAEQCVPLECVHGHHCSSSPSEGHHGEVGASVVGSRQEFDALLGEYKSTSLVIEQKMVTEGRYAMKIKYGREEKALGFDIKDDMDQHLLNRIAEYRKVDFEELVPPERNHYDKSDGL